MKYIAIKKKEWKKIFIYYLDAFNKEEAPTM